MPRPAALALAALILAATPLAGRAAPADRAVPMAAPAAAASWQSLIRPDDRKRLTGLWRAWTRALGEVHGEGTDLSTLGPLGDPGAARAAPPPPPGRYRCRLVRLGRGDTAPSGMPVVGTLPAGDCTVTAIAGGLWFEQQDGAQRIAGKLWSDGDRQVFLGSLKLAGEAGVMAYGDDRARDQVGVLRAIGDRRWRLELPWPRWQSDLCLVEIVPA